VVTPICPLSPSNEFAFTSLPVSIMALCGKGGEYMNKSVLVMISEGAPIKTFQDKYAMALHFSAFMVILVVSSDNREISSVIGFSRLGLKFSRSLSSRSGSACNNCGVRDWCSLIDGRKKEPGVLCAEEIQHSQAIFEDLCPWSTPCSLGNEQPLVSKDE
jgi:hypothetical protein